MTQQHRSFFIINHQVHEDATSRKHQLMITGIQHCDHCFINCNHQHSHHYHHHHHHQNAWAVEAYSTDRFRWERPRLTARSHSCWMEAAEPSPIWWSQVCLGCLLKPVGGRILHIIIALHQMFKLSSWLSEQKVNGPDIYILPLPG